MQTLREFKMFKTVRDSTLVNEYGAGKVGNDLGKLLQLNES